jgi:hypothetical protein
MHCHDTMSSRLDRVGLTTLVRRIFAVNNIEESDVFMNRIFNVVVRCPGLYLIVLGDCGC